MPPVGSEHAGGGFYFAPLADGRSLPPNIITSMPLALWPLLAGVLCGESISPLARSGLLVKLFEHAPEGCRR
jgi:hypothetical protein